MQTITTLIETIEQTKSLYARAISGDLSPAEVGVAAGGLRVSVRRFPAHVETLGMCPADVERAHAAIRHTLGHLDACVIVSGYGSRMRRLELLQRYRNELEAAIDHMKEAKRLIGGPPDDPDPDGGPRPDGEVLARLVSDVLDSHSFENSGGLECADTRSAAHVLEYGIRLHDLDVPGTGFPICGPPPERPDVRARGSRLPVLILCDETQNRKPLDTATGLRILKVLAACRVTLTPPHHVTDVTGRPRRHPDLDGHRRLRQLRQLRQPCTGTLRAGARLGRPVVDRHPPKRRTPSDTSRSSVADVTGPLRPLPRPRRQLRQLRPRHHLRRSHCRGSLAGSTLAPASSREAD